MHIFFFVFIHKRKKGREIKLINNAKDILIKTPSFPVLCMSVTNLEAMYEYVWMSICIFMKKKERERKRNCWSVSCSFFFSFSFFLFKVRCYLGFKWPLFIVFINVNAHIFKWCWGQSIGNCVVWWSMIWACACGQAKGASLTLSYIYIYTWHVWYKKIIWIMVNLHLKLTNDDEHHKGEAKKEKMSFLIQ
jgi:hypothetical protein